MPSHSAGTRTATAPNPTLNRPTAQKFGPKQGAGCRNLGKIWLKIGCQMRRLAIKAEYWQKIAVECEKFAKIGYRAQKFRINCSMEQDFVSNWGSEAKFG